MFRAQTNAFDDVVVKATDENLTSENWEYILVSASFASYPYGWALLAASRAARARESLFRHIVMLTARCRTYAIKSPLRTLEPKMPWPP